MGSFRDNSVALSEYKIIPRYIREHVLPDTSLEIFGKRLDHPVMGAPMVGTDCYIEASGAGSVLEQIPAQAKAGARVSIVALHYAPVPVNFLLVMMKQLTLRGAMEYPDDYARTIDLLGRRDLSPMITHRFPLDRFHEALEVARNPQLGGKVMVDMI